VRLEVGLNVKCKKTIRSNNEVIIVAKRLIRLREVINETGLCRSSIYAKIGEETFPPPVPIGDRAIAWVEEEVQDWIQKQMNKRSALTVAENVDASISISSPSVSLIQQRATPDSARKRKAA
jgi:prophage regulatory protein